MLAARRGQHRRNLFTNVLGKERSTAAASDAVRLATIDDTSKTPLATQRHVACVRSDVRLRRGAPYVRRSERATHRRGSPVAGSLPLVLGNPRCRPKRGAGEQLGRRVDGLQLVRGGATGRATPLDRPARRVTPARPERQAPGDPARAEILYMSLPSFASPSL